MEVGAEESLLRHCMPSLGIPWDSHVFRMRVMYGKAIVPFT